jgi:hypothetical protein
LLFRPTGDGFVDFSGERGPWGSMGVSFFWMRVCGEESRLGGDLQTFENVVFYVTSR